ncbi:hypothetical protein Golomagni_05714 [Golovinomyces magnicellulatus]|nr:hypothetical protein Golomagni_05714 [Golovinomyces magnicellulatus]
MRYAFVTAALAASVSGHGVITAIQGANNVTMPGLSIADGTPRDCSTNGCGSQADTSIIRDRDVNSGKASPLGRTQGNGPVDAANIIRTFMGNGNNAPTNQGSSGSSGQEDDLSGLNRAAGGRGGNRDTARKRGIADLFKGVLGGGDGKTGLAGLAGGGGSKSNFKSESIVADTAGDGASSGLPTADDNGEISMVFRQINQDGAGPLTAAVDGTSGGTDASAFQNAEVTQDVPGLGIQGLSLATNTEFPLKVKMPQGMTCDASVGGANNVCVVRVRNGAAAGPFGGSAAFTQSNTARKRAIAYRLKKRMEISRD